MKKVIGVFFILFNITLGFSQTNEVLFTIDDKPFYSDEFLRVYNKNLNLVKDDSQKDLDTYLDLYIAYKLKVEKAKKLGLQNEAKYQSELNSYRTQLAKNYINDSKITEELVQQAYDRTLEEVKASHILILVDENAAPKDTLAAYNKISDIKKRIAKGEDFAKLAEELSEDPSAKMNKGDLGYFSVFRMVYPFENAAYNTSVGKVSDIFRTRFGYHILQVTDKRKNRGEIEVKHIMLLNPKETTAEANKEVKGKIYDIYKKLQQGESFEELAQQFSDDKSTAGKGGLLQRFGSGQLTSQEFENVAFSLQNPDDFSEPFQSQFGWHIVKLVKKYPVKSFDDMKYELENRIKNDSRSLLITNSLNKKLKTKYTIERNEDLYKQIVKSVDDSYYQSEWKKAENSKAYEATLLTINNDKRLKGSYFLQYLESMQKSPSHINPIQKLVADYYEKWINLQLTTYYDENLETEFPEFHYVMEEYRDGLLLFDLMEKEIWEKAKNDTIGLEKFYNTNKNSYFWNNRYDVDLYSSTNKKNIGKVQKYLKNNKKADYIKAKLNTKEEISVMEKSRVFEENDDDISFLNLPKMGVSEIGKSGNYYFVAKVKAFLPKANKTIEECRGKLSSDYQQYLEDNWVSSLKKDFKVNVNRPVFEKLKLKIKN